MNGDTADSVEGPLGARRGSFLRGLGSLALSGGLVLGLSFVIAWPMWSLATGHRRAFTIAAGVLAGLGALAFVLRAVARPRRRGAARGRGRRSRRP